MEGARFPLHQMPKLLLSPRPGLEAPPEGGLRTGVGRDPDLSSVPRGSDHPKRGGSRGSGRGYPPWAMGACLPGRVPAEDRLAPVARRASSRHTGTEVRLERAFRAPPLETGGFPWVLARRWLFWP